MNHTALSEYKVLRLNKAGQPLEWLTLEDAACAYAKGQVVWTLGEKGFRLHGGLSRLTGQQTVLEIDNIIATDGEIHAKHALVPALTNDMLFKRDAMLCLYCGDQFEYAGLTRDHVIPKSRNGRDIWSNCASACRSCNNRKGNRTPEEAGMTLLAVPFKPNKAEYLALANRRILADQMEFLSSQFSNHRDWH